MKLRFSVILSLLVCTWSCKKSDNTPVTPPNTDPDIIAVENNRLSAAITTQTATTFISGTVVDEDGKALPGVSVASGNATITTNDKGFFQFPGSVTVNKDYAIITAARNGYFKAIKTFTPNSSGKANQHFEIKLLKESVEKTVAADGGNVVLDDKVDLSFPNAAVVTSTGAAYTGQYKVVGRYIDPESANFFETMPGLLAGLNDENKVQALQSLGMAVVELRDASGNSLQIAPGKKVTMKLPAAADAPATIPLWHFNEKFGLWIRAGTATKTGNVYTAEVNHFSVWNLDLEFNNFRLDLQFKDAQGNALSGVYVSASTEGVNKIKSFYTDNEGKATLINCPSSKPLTIKAIFQCDTTVKTLDPLTANRSEVITLAYGPGVTSYTITGKLSGCDDVALANQPFQISIRGDGNSYGIPGVTDADGNYILTGVICNTNGTAAIQAMAFIDNQYKYAPAVNITTSNSIYNAKICDTASGVAENFEILFPDPVLDSLIRARINRPSGAIYYADVKNIDSLDGYNTIISDISGIQFCNNLKVLFLHANFSNLSLLKNLPSLQTLSIVEAGDGLITDISALQNLTQLQTLELTGSNLSDISPLSGLTQVRWLSLTCGALTDLNAIQNFAQLRNLTITGKVLTNIDVLKNFKQLNSLDIIGTPMSDFSVLQNLPQLEILHLDGNHISDVNQFSQLTKLFSLSLKNNTITDISGLQNMINMQYLELNSNQVTDISVVRNMPQAIIINFMFNNVSDLTPVKDLINLNTLWIQANNVSDISPLINGVPNLTSLLIYSQQTGPISTTQQNAFKTSHPNCGVTW